MTWLAALGRIFTNIDTDQLERFQVQAMSDFEKLLELKRDDGRSILPASILVEIAVSSLFAIQERDYTTKNHRQKTSGTLTSRIERSIQLKVDNLLDKK